MSKRSTVFQVRHDWPHKIAPPRILTFLIGAAMLALGVVFMAQDRSRTFGSAYAVMQQWGMNLGSHSRPMLPWGVLFTVAGSVALYGWARLQPVLTGMGVFLGMLVEAVNAYGAWHSALHRGPHSVVGFGPVPPASYTTAIAITTLTLWWLMTSGTLLAVREDQEWPYQ